MLANVIGHRLRSAAEIARCCFARYRCPEQGMTPRYERNGRGPNGCDTRVLTIRWAVARLQPCPRHATGKASLVEPRRLVPGNSGRQELAFPCGCRRFEAF